MQKYILALPLLFCLTSCGQTELPYKSLVVSKGLHYDSQTEELFSGIATNSSPIVYSTLIAMKATNFKISSQLKCTSEFSQGKLNGLTICTNQEGDELVELNMIDNHLEGLQTIRHQSSGELYFEAEYVKTKLEGEKNIYNADGELIYEGEFKDGYIESLTEWTEDGEIVTLEIDEDSGFEWKLEDVGSWPYGQRGLCKINYTGSHDWKEHGKKECFYMPKEVRYSLTESMHRKDDGVLAESSEYDKGKKTGLWVEWDDKGKKMKETEHGT